ncbi:MAG: GNAT family N-acetyltransferase [Anaerolineae bacterium]
MDIDVNNLDVRNNPDAGRFEVQLGDELAMVEYNIAGKNIIFTHTEVPPAYEGQGIANKMAEVALAYAREHGYKIQPLCPFINTYIRRHKEYQDITWGY